MYLKGYGLIEPLAPLHVGASAGEESGNLNLIFKDQFTQTGIIPGSSIRGRFRADMRRQASGQEQHWYGHEAEAGQPESTTEAKVKFEYASLVWIPVFCPGQPVVWVTCPRLLRRYRMITGEPALVPPPYSAPPGLQGRQIGTSGKVLFFNLGFLEIEYPETDLIPWIPEGTQLYEGANRNSAVVVSDNDIAMIHDMALYRQSRVKLDDNEKKVSGGAFFNVEAIPEGSIFIFPVAQKISGWQPFGADETTAEMYFGGLESIGFGRSNVRLVLEVEN